VDNLSRALVDLPRVRREIAIGGRAWVVETVEDEDALLAASETSAQFPFGLMLWESAIALAEDILAEPHLVAGKSVLELGCGIGLTGTIAAHLGAHVTATDHDGSALEAAQRTARLNGVSDLKIAPGDWTDWRIPGRFDVILAADVTYDAAHHDALLSVLDHALTPGGTVRLADPGRTSQGAFRAAAKASGWTVACVKRAVADLKRPNATVDVTMLTLVRRR